MDSENKKGNVKAEVTGGILLSWGATHRDKYGVLICRLASVNAPSTPTCLTPRCLIRYFWDSLKFVLIASYHARRVAYAEASVTITIVDGERIRTINPILERYRTGEPSPQTIWQAIHANWKLACPICRKYNVDPLLGRSVNHEESTGQGS